MSIRQGISGVAAAVALLVLLQTQPAHAQPPVYSWRARDADPNIRLSTSASPRHRFDAVKATAIVSASASHLLAVLQAFEHYPLWYYRASEVRVLQRPQTLPEVAVEPDGKLTRVPSAGPWLLHFRQRIPAIADRWTLLRCGLRAGAHGSVLMEFHSVKPAYDVEGAVRMELRGYWQLRPLTARQTEVTFMLDVDPNTLAPAFLVDPELRDVVVQTLRQMQAR